MRVTEMEEGKGMTVERRLAMCFTEGKFGGQILRRDSCRWTRAWR